MKEYYIARGNQGFGRVGTATTEIIVDLPLAMADWLHAVPSLYSEDVGGCGAVTGWKVVALLVGR